MNKIADMHCDTILGIYGEGKSLYENDLHVDVKKLKKSDYILQNFAVFVKLNETKQPFQTCMDMIGCFKRELSKYTDEISQIYSYSDIEQNIKSGIISAMLTVEEGGTCEGDISKLHTLYSQGVRMLTITWNYINELGYPNAVNAAGAIADFKTPNTTEGLTAKGYDFITEMESLRMIVDVSHLSDAGFYDVVNCSKKPFVASHSNARALTSHRRNLTDDMIRKLAERGGVIGANYAPEFLQHIDNLKDAVGTLDDIVRHIMYIRNIGGSECIGLGSDFDGIDTNRDLQDASYMDLLADRLGRAGLGSNDIDDIFYRNVLKLYKECL